MSNNETKPSCLISTAVGNDNPNKVYISNDRISWRCMFATYEKGVLLWVDKTQPAVQSLLIQKEDAA